jgi:hypothetical protein
MKQNQNLGTEQLRDRADHDSDKLPAQPERDFTEAGHTQPQPADAHPGRDTPHDKHGRAS